MRRAARVDNSQSSIVSALRKIGATVYFIGNPVDLLVGYRARNFLLECKTAGSSYKGTPKQKTFLSEWKGQVRIVKTPEEAIDVVTKAYAED